MASTISRYHSDRGREPFLLSKTSPALKHHRLYSPPPYSRGPQVQGQGQGQGRRRFSPNPSTSFSSYGPPLLSRSDRRFSLSSADSSAPGSPLIPSRRGFPEHLPALLAAEPDTNPYFDPLYAFINKHGTPSSTPGDSVLNYYQVSNSNRSSGRSTPAESIYKPAESVYNYARNVSRMSTPTDDESVHSRARVDSLRRQVSYDSQERAYSPFGYQHPPERFVLPDPGEPEENYGRVGEHVEETGDWPEPMLQLQVPGISLDPVQPSPNYSIITNPWETMEAPIDPEALHDERRLSVAYSTSSRGGSDVSTVMPADYESLEEEEFYMPLVLTRLMVRIVPNKFSEPYISMTLISPKLTYITLSFTKSSSTLTTCSTAGLVHRDDKDFTFLPFVSAAETLPQAYSVNIDNPEAAVQTFKGTLAPRYPDRKFEQVWRKDTSEIRACVVLRLMGFVDNDSPAGYNKKCDAQGVVIRVDNVCLGLLMLDGGQVEAERWEKVGGQWMRRFCEGEGGWLPCAVACCDRDEDYDEECVFSLKLEEFRGPYKVMYRRRFRVEEDGTCDRVHLGGYFWQMAEVERW